MIRRLLSILTGRPIPARPMPVVPVPQFPAEPRVMRRTEPAVRLDRMSIAKQHALWKKTRAL